MNKKGYKFGVSHEKEHEVILCSQSNKAKSNHTDEIDNTANQRGTTGPGGVGNCFLSSVVLERCHSLEHKVLCNRQKEVVWKPAAWTVQHSIPEVNMVCQMPSCSLSS